jgi:hypothetical protein
MNDTHENFLTDLLDRLGIPFASRMYHFGSRTIPGAAREDSDWDYMVLLREPLTVDTREDLRSLGMQFSIEQYEGRLIESWRKDEMNIVFTTSQEVFDLQKLANDLCVRLGVTDKQSRCDIFGAVVYQNRTWEGWGTVIRDPQRSPLAQSREASPARTAATLGVAASSVTASEYAARSAGWGVTQVLVDDIRGTVTSG